MRSDWDFVLHLPLRYEDETRIAAIAALTDGAEQQVEGTVTAANVVFRGRRQLHVQLQDASGTLLLRFLHFYPSQLKQMAVGQRVRAFGTARMGFGGAEMVHPRVRAVRDGEALPTALTPIYPTSAGVPQSWLRRRIAQALRTVELSDLLSDAARRQLQLDPLRDALLLLHNPPSGAAAGELAARNAPAWQRIRFDELLAQQIALRLARAARRQRRAPVLAPPAAAPSLTGALLAALPFALTGAQQRVWHEVETDLARESPMQRLVQGDVGSGKTVIAALAAARAIECGRQAALMAPTELLAEQHFGRIAQWLAPLGVPTQWLAGRLTPAAKRRAQQQIAEGTPQLVIGTHALIQDAVSFPNLGLAIVDEQHRFGVAQRLALRDAEADLAPHMLMLSATPIPRTLAMSYLADLDVSVIDELPPGRRAVITKLASAQRRDEVIARIRAEVAAGRQAYWVCPLVEESDVIEAAAATATHAHISALLSELPPGRIGLLHGQLPAEQKTAVMQAFAEGRIDVLVATTVIEVGVDVANATLMVIEHAERFGLAQLHQLRGRVGRGAAQSYCLLLFEEPLSEAARERLKIVYETTDGFEVARRDLAMRGPGEFLGARQAGVPLLRFADLEQDTELLEQARAMAGQLLTHDVAAAREHLRRWYEGRSDFLAA